MRESSGGSRKMKRGVHNHHSRGSGGAAPQMLKGIFIFT